MSEGTGVGKTPEKNVQEGNHVCWKKTLQFAISHTALGEKKGFLERANIGKHGIASTG